MSIDTDAPTYHRAGLPLRRVLLVHGLLTLPKADALADALADLLQRRRADMTYIVCPHLRDQRARTPRQPTEFALQRWAETCSERVADEPRFHAVVVMAEVLRDPYAVLVRTALSRQVQVQHWDGKEIFRKISNIDANGVLAYAG